MFSRNFSYLNQGLMTKDTATLFIKCKDYGELTVDDMIPLRSPNENI